MIRLRGSGRIGPPQNDAGANTEVVLAAAGAQKGARKICHQVIRLDKAPCKIPGEHHVHASAHRERKRALGLVAGKLTAAVRSAEKNFTERNKMIEAPEVQAGTEEVGLHVSADGRGRLGIGW